MVIRLWCFLFFIIGGACFLSFDLNAEQGYGGNFDTVFSQIGNPENVSVYVSKITFSCDIYFNPKEFFYLLDLNPGNFVAKGQVDRAYRQLMAKKRFSSIDIDITDTRIGKHLHFVLTANWILKKVEFEGVWVGKPKYAAFYLQLQRSGDVFNSDFHEEAIGDIEKYLHDQGYFNCIVTDRLVYSKKHKTISVKIRVKKKSRFRVSKARVVFADMEKKLQLKQDKDLCDLTRVISSKFQSALESTYYSKKSIKKLMKKFKKRFKDFGFVNPRLELVKSVELTKSAVSLTLNVLLGSRKVITFSGNTVFSSEFIKDELIGSDLPDWFFSPDIIAQQLLHEYYKRGYWHTVVRTKKTGDKGFHFSIDEGESVLVQRAEVVDSHTYLLEKATILLNSFLKDKKCDQTILESGLEQLKDFYFINGFWDFKIVKQYYIKNKDTGNYIVKVLIEKGRQRLWAGFSIDGFKQLEESDFFRRYKFFDKNKHIPFNLAWVQEQRSFLLSYFQNLGYWYAQVQPEFTILPGTSTQDDISSQTTKVFLHWKVIPDKRVKFGKTIIRGNTTIPFQRLKKQFKFKENDLWRRDKLELTRKRLKRLDVFKTVQLRSYRLSKGRSKKPVIVTLVDDDPIELRARLGYFLTSKNFLFKRQSTPKIGTSFIIKNPTNRADRLAFEGDWTKFERKFTVDYQQPSPFGLAAMSTLKGFANKYVHPVQIGQSGSAYEALQTGVLVGLSDEYKETYYWGINFGNELLKTSRVRGNLKLDKKMIDTVLPYFFVEPSLKIDKLDSKVDTTKGLFSLIFLKMMFPENSGDVTAKLLIEQSIFYPIYKKLIFAWRLRFGHIFRRKFEKIMPVERFYLGGPYSVRGYEPDALPPLGVSERVTDGKTIKYYTIQGGSSMINVNLELRFPLFRSLGAVLFQDIGILSQSGFLGLKDRWYPGSGFGLRYKTPIGSIRFDIGWKWKRRIEEDKKSYAWYLTLGEVF